MTATLKVIDGTPSTPGIAFNSESANGLYRPSNGTVALTVSCVEASRANNGGRLMLGTTSDDGSTRLQVSGNVSATTFVGALSGTASNATTLGTYAPATTGTPNTIALRDSSGYLTVGYLNQNSAIETTTIGAIFVHNSAAGGYLRKTSMATFMSQVSGTAPISISGKRGDCKLCDRCDDGEQADDRPQPCPVRRCDRHGDHF